MRLTPEQMRIAIAEVRKWKIIATEEYEWIVISPDGYQVAWSSQGGSLNDHPAWYYLPDYLGDLNAMHEAEKVLTDLQWEDYERHLRKICGGLSWYEGAGKELLSATAAQRAEAFCLTLGIDGEEGTA